MYSGGSGLSIDIHFVDIELSYDVLSPLPIVLSKHFNHPHPYIEIATATSDKVEIGIRDRGSNLYAGMRVVEMSGLSIDIHFVDTELSYDVLSPVLSKHFNHLGDCSGLSKEARRWNSKNQGSSQLTIWQWLTRAHRV